VIEWEPSMSVGEETIDSQHRKLLEQINKLVKILSSMEVDISSLRETIHFLYTYIKEHFDYEEKYMERIGFPGLENHRKIHRQFVRFYEDLQKDLKEKSTSGSFSSVEIKELLKKVQTYLVDWLVHHIKGADQEYAKYIESKN